MTPLLIYVALAVSFLVLVIVAIMYAIFSDEDEEEDKKMSHYQIFLSLISLVVGGTIVYAIGAVIYTALMG